jgi:hypothetical protein
MQIPIDHQSARENWLFLMDDNLLSSNQSLVSYREACESKGQPEHELNWYLEAEQLHHAHTAQSTITCKTGPNMYKKNFLGLSDNVTYFAEQIDAAPADVYHYRVIFKPASVIPNVEVK